MAEPPETRYRGDELPSAGQTRLAALATLLTPAELAQLARAERLSNQERAVFALIGAGLKPKAVAIDLALSVKTVETMVERIRLKLAPEDGKSISAGDLAFLARLWVRANERTCGGFPDKT